MQCAAALQRVPSSWAATSGLPSSTRWTRFKALTRQFDKTLYNTLCTLGGAAQHATDSHHTMGAHRRAEDSMSSQKQVLHPTLIAALVGAEHMLTQCHAA